MRTLFNRAVLCPMCGKRAKKNTYAHYGEPYKGNMIVLKTNYSNFTSAETGERVHCKNDDGTRMISSQTIWDGETYYHNYGNFCSTGCAIQYANIIVDRSGLNNSNKVKRGEY